MKKPQTKGFWSWLMGHGWDNAGGYDVFFLSNPALGIGVILASLVNKRRDVQRRRDEQAAAQGFDEAGEIGEQDAAAGQRLRGGRVGYGRPATSARPCSCRRRIPCW